MKIMQQLEPGVHLRISLKTKENQGNLRRDGQPQGHLCAREQSGKQKNVVAPSRLNNERAASKSNARFWGDEN
jgi:hypothetical protein